MSKKKSSQWKDYKTFTLSDIFQKLIGNNLYFVPVSSATTMEQTTPEFYQQNPDVLTAKLNVDWCTSEQDLMSYETPIPSIVPLSGYPTSVPDAKSIPVPDLCKLQEFLVGSSTGVKKTGSGSCWNGHYCNGPFKYAVTFSPTEKEWWPNTGKQDWTYSVGNTVCTNPSSDLTKFTDQPVCINGEYSCVAANPSVYSTINSEWTNNSP